MTSAENWETVHRTKPPTDTSWFEPEPEVSLRLVESVAGPMSSLIDIGAGTSFLVDRLLQRGWRDITLLDVSTTALTDTRARFVNAEVEPDLVIADVTEWIPRRIFDVWHDRAVFHFMSTPELRDRYRRALSHAVRPGGHVVIGTFAENGPQQCSGINVARYSVTSLVAEFDPAFRCVASEQHVHHTPWGAEQPFTWVVLRRSDGPLP